MTEKGQSTQKNNQFSSKVKIPRMVRIPEGRGVIMGISRDQIDLLLRTELWAEEWFDKDLFSVELPQHSVHIKAFELGRGPVSNADYHQFIWDKGHRVPKEWIGFRYAEGLDAHPVVGVSLLDALTYIEWLNTELNTTYRLPSEAEWEYAARGGDARLYPWGDEFDPWRCNTLESGKHGTTTIGEYSPGGDTPFGLMDMSGNVWEWTTSLLRTYPYIPTDGREDPEAKSKEKFVIRGGAWYYSHKLARTTVRESALANFSSPALGFRLARSV